MLVPSVLWGCAMGYNALVYTLERTLLFAESVWSQQATIGQDAWCEMRRDCTTFHFNNVPAVTYLMELSSHASSPTCLHYRLHNQLPRARGSVLEGRSHAWWGDTVKSYLKLREWIIESLETISINRQERPLGQRKTPLPRNSLLWHPN